MFLEISPIRTRLRDLFFLLFELYRFRELSGGEIRSCLWTNSVILDFGFFFSPFGKEYTHLVSSMMLNFVFNFSLKTVSNSVLEYGRE